MVFFIYIIGPSSVGWATYTALVIGVVHAMLPM